MDTALYDKDFYLWTIQNANLLREGRLTEIDIENIAEELESMGRSEKRELLNRLAVLIAHLIKWKYRLSIDGEISGSWDGTIIEQRRKIKRLLKENPSLQSLLNIESLQSAKSFNQRQSAVQTSSPINLPQIVNHKPSRSQRHDNPTPPNAAVWFGRTAKCKIP